MGISFEQLAHMSPEDRDAENSRVWAIRSETLVGRAIIGTLTTTERRGRTFYWISWNKAKCDSVKVPRKALEEIGMPPVGSTIKCVVTGLGPDISKVKSAWCAHPLCKECVLSDPSEAQALRKPKKNESSRFFPGRSHSQYSHGSKRVLLATRPKATFSKHRSKSPSWRKPSVRSFCG